MFSNRPDEIKKGPYYLAWKYSNDPPHRLFTQLIPLWFRGVSRKFGMFLAVFITNGRIARIDPGLAFMKFVYSCHSWSIRLQYSTGTIYLRDVCTRELQKEPLKDSAFLILILPAAILLIFTYYAISLFDGFHGLYGLCTSRSCEYAQNTYIRSGEWFRRTLPEIIERVFEMIHK